MGRIEPTLALDGLGRADVVIEAVVEDLGIKQGIFRELETLVPETVVSLARRMGKTPVVVGDAPGFLVNRILMPYLGEAVVLVERGVPIETIDKALRQFGMPLGPLELLDEIGLDVARKVAHVLEEAFAERMPRTALLDRLASEGALGKKSGRGFYLYEKGKRGATNPALAPAAPKTSVPVGPPPREIVDRPSRGRACRTLRAPPVDGARRRPFPSRDPAGTRGSTDPRGQRRMKCQM
jgi:3-hydroxyacyl-CoA dehydrogenase